ncbi:MAG: fatty acyl-AMP ligase, partial [Actinomadura rubrobrunea]|nr:fatty acyl-AMP ligase [Actinomadura rubrobrunea]
DLAGVWWAQVPDLAAGLADPAADHPADPAHPAFLQYTSGSTALPKGVVVTHEALAHNLELMRVALRHDERLRMVSWLPMFHDMGLIGNVLAPLWVGGTMILMEPLAFVKRPARWLRLIDRERATVSGGPNFAYDLCVRRVRDEEIEGLDLSGWRSAFNGAEPIRPATLRAFAERFAPYGFRPNAWWPCYGLAEATLFVTGNTVGAEPTTLDVDPDALQLGDVVPADGGRTLVSSGRTWLDRTVLIVDPDTRRPVPPGRVGEIWIGGPGLPAGYWENPEATEETFGARTVGGDPDDGPYLRSGDLGFVHEGELYVTGRLKDVLIVAGRNHYPQDIEATAEDAHPAIRKGCVAAFSVDDGDGERVVVVAGAGQGAVKPGEQGAALRAEIARAVRARVTAEHGIEVHDVAVVGPNTVPKTSSGKLQRRACRAAYLAGRYALDADPAGGPAGERTQQTERHESERRTVR